MDICAISYHLPEHEQLPVDERPGFLLALPTPNSWDRAYHAALRPAAAEGQGDVLDQGLFLWTYVAVHLRKVWGYELDGERPPRFPCGEGVTIPDQVAYLRQWMPSAWLELLFRRLCAMAHATKEEERGGSVSPSK